MGIHLIVYVIVTVLSLVTAYAVGMPTEGPRAQQQETDKTDQDSEKDASDVRDGL